MVLTGGGLKQMFFKFSSEHVGVDSIQFDEEGGNVFLFTSFLRVDSIDASQIKPYFSIHGICSCTSLHGFIFGRTSNRKAESQNKGVLKKIRPNAAKKER